MYQTTKGAVIVGLSALPLEIECYIGNGLPSFTIVGLSSGTETDTRERIRSALKSAGITLPASRITVNIRPIDPRVASLTGAATKILDLPIALLIAACLGLIPGKALSQAVFLGQLSLSGTVKPLYGALSIAGSVSGLDPAPKALYLPLENAREGALCSSLSVCGLHSLSEALQVLTHKIRLEPSHPAEGSEISPGPSLFDSIKGQEIAKHLLVIAASGMHNLLLIGPPGCGKTLLSRCLPSLMPPLSYQEKLELTQIYSCSGLLPAGCSLMTERPFRQPHHSITDQALLGGGLMPKPGEVTLAHKGILFLDEFAEIRRSSLEGLREPLEEHKIRVSRLQGDFVYPADFLLIGAMNPCPCGYFPDKSRCTCSSFRIRQYYQKINSPILDRIDLVLNLRPVDPSDMDKPSVLTFAKAREQILRATRMQQNRFQSGTMYNSRMNVKEIEAFCPLGSAEKNFLAKVMENLSLSMRAYHKLLKTARTLADIDESLTIEREHLIEALQYRYSPSIEDRI